MSYSPYASAFSALTNEQARSFYAATAIDHSRKTAFAAVMMGIAAYSLGVHFRTYHDAKLVPGMRQWWVRTLAKRLSSAKIAGYLMSASEVAPEENPWDAEMVLGDVESVGLRVIPIGANTIIGFLPPAQPVKYSNAAQDYDQLPVKQLRSRLKSRGIKVPGKSTKALLIQVLVEDDRAALRKYNAENQ
jgi:hypothetical protein